MGMIKEKDIEWEVLWKEKFQNKKYLPKLEMGKREKESDGGPGAKGSGTVSLVQC